MLDAIHVACKLNISVRTLTLWYKWAKLNPDNTYAQMLPKYEQSGPRAKRLWKKEDIKALKKFQKAIPKGRAGIMSEVTQPNK